MAKEGGFGEIITLALVGGAAYIAWQWWSTQQSSAATQTATTGTPTPPAPPAYVYTPPTASAQLVSAAQSNTVVQAQGGQADAYQWQTIYNEQPGLPSIANVNINSTFFPNGLPANQTSLAKTSGYSQQGLPLMSAQTFISGLTAAGISGLSGFGQVPRLIPVPIMLSPGKRTIVNLPAGTRPADLQRHLRTGA